MKAMIARTFIFFFDDSSAIVFILIRFILMKFILAITMRRESISVVILRVIGLASWNDTF